MDRDDRFPGAVIVAPAAVAAMNAIAEEAYHRQKTEWGGLLWGHTFQDPELGIVPVVLAATCGRCCATPTRCEILPESWEEGRRLLARTGRRSLRNLGDWHSHPRMGVFMSQTDLLSFWSYGHVPDWLSIIVDPFNDQIEAFARESERACRAIHPVIPSAAVLAGLERAADRHYHELPPARVS